MWLDCEIQLAGSPEQRRLRGVHIRIETMDGVRRTLPVDITTVRYEVGQFYAQPAWGVDGPADCYQTGAGYVHFEPQGLTQDGVVGTVATLFENNADRALKVSFGQLSEDSQVQERLSA